MAAPPFYFVPITHPVWAEALACARRLPPEAMAELRLDLFPDEDPEAMVRDLGGRCLVTCRRAEEGGAWTGDEAGRLERLLRGARSRPEWVDLEWDLEVPPALEDCLSHVRLLRSVHVPPGVFDLEQRLRRLPRGDAFKWVGHAHSLTDNARMRAPLAWARDHEVALSAFLMGPKGMASRCMQAAWGGCFTYAQPDDAGPAAPGQVTLGRMLGWRCHKLHAGYRLCGVLGQPALHSLGPGYHNPRFQRAFKDLLYLPLECGDPGEAMAALEALDLVGASLTAPLKTSLPALLGLAGPLNTLWRRRPGEPWQGANTDAIALEGALDSLEPGPVLLLGAGGVAETSRRVLQARGWACLQGSRSAPVPADAVRGLRPVGVIQATRLGMEPGDPAPFPELLAAAEPSVRWGVEWIYKEDTVFAAWVRDGGRRLVAGGALFEGQAAAQSAAFIRECGG
ncbi:MAG: type I 3-dehydroquinate dehydratase [Holophaga sp.]|nr:type I 3-dehydroquinate dehydratase [Holophaga sp.]